MEDSKYTSTLQRGDSTIRSIERLIDGNIGRTDLMPQPDELNKLIGDVKELQKEISIRLKSGQTYQKLRRFYMERIQGKKYHSLEDLFDLQLNAINIMAYGLRLGGEYAKRDLTDLEHYVDFSYSKLKENINNYTSVEGRIKLLQEHYSKLQKYLGSPKCSGEIRFKAKDALRKSKRALEEHDGNFRETQDEIIDLDIETKCLDTLESYFRDTLKSSQRLAKETERTESHIRNTKKAYLWCYLHNKMSKKLIEIVDVTTQSIYQLQDTIIQERLEIDNIQNNKKKVFEESQVKLEEARKSSKRITNGKDELKERRVKQLIAEYSR